MRTTAAPVKDHHGRVVAAVAACQDITGEVELTAARNRLHEELTAKTALLEAVVRNAPIGIVVTDAVGRFVSVNERFKTIFGADVPASIEDYARWSVHDADRSARDVTRKSALAHALRGETVTHKFQFRRSDGVERRVCITAAPVHDASNVISSQRWRFAKTSRTTWRSRGRATVSWSKWTRSAQNSDLS